MHSFEGRTPTTLLFMGDVTGSFLDAVLDEYVAVRPPAGCKSKRRQEQEAMARGGSQEEAMAPASANTYKDQ